jgi:hypothetical protein
MMAVMIMMIFIIIIYKLTFTLLECNVLKNVCGEVFLVLTRVSSSTS